MLHGLKLLLWKNWKIQSRRKLSLLMEITVPGLFVIVFMGFRYCLKWTDFEEPTEFPAFSIRGNLPSIIRNFTSIIYYAPKDQLANRTMELVDEHFFKKEGLSYTFQGFSDESEMERAYRKSTMGLSGIGNETSSPVLAGIVFYHKNSSLRCSTHHPQLPTNIQYKLKFPATQRTNYDGAERLNMFPGWYEDKVYTIYATSGPRFKDKVEGGFPGYFDEGFLYLQYALDYTITRQLVAFNKSLVEQHNQLTENIQLRRFPYGSYTKEKVILFFENCHPAVIASCLTYVVMCFTKQIIEEKSSRLKEFTKIMGLVPWMHWTSWFIRFFIIQVLSSVLIAVGVKIKIKGKGIYMRTDPIIVFTTYAINSLPVIGFSFFMSTISSTPEAGATTAGLIWVTVFLTWYSVSFKLHGWTYLRTYLVAVLSPSTGLNMVNLLMGNMDAMGVGSQWDNIFEGLDNVNYFSIPDGWLAMACNGLMYMFLAFYIDLVRPGDFGVPLPWYFPCTKWYWIGGVQAGIRDLDHPSKCTDQDNVSIENLAHNVEAVPEDFRVGVEISNLTKKFKEKVAVNSLSVKMYEGHVTSVLGHNGAGKTTTMSILTGLIRPSSGTAYVNSFDIRKDMSHIRFSLGLCPQYNILFENMTVEEHLEFFCKLKGFEPQNIHEEIERMLEALDLVDKRSAPAKTLSGGMKRKLCVGIAFTAGPKTVILDEPTAGMDIEARRSIWDLIQSQKAGRTVLLSTHYMEEADLLGDRIMILSGGLLQCCGCSLFLKEKYGYDYSLVMVKKEPCHIPAIHGVIQDIIPPAVFNQNMDSELKYTLPTSYINKYAALFQELDNRKDELGIDSYGVSSPTMEEIFLRVGLVAKQQTKEQKLDLIPEHENLHHENVEGSGPQRNTELAGQPCRKLKRNDRNLVEPRITGARLYWNQFWTLLLKKVLVSFRDWKLTLLLIAVPITCISTSIYCFRFSPGEYDPKALFIRQDKLGLLKKSPFYAHCDADFPEFCDKLKQFTTNYSKMHFREVRTPISSHLVEKVRKDGWKITHKTILALDVTQQSSNATGLKRGPKNITAFFNSEPLHTPAFALNFVSNAILHSLDANVQLNVINDPFLLNHFDDFRVPGGTLTTGFLLGVCINFGISFLSAAFIIFSTRERVSKFVHLQEIAGASKHILWLANFLVDLVICFVGAAGVLCYLNVREFEEFCSWKQAMGLFVLLSGYGICGIFICMFLSTVCKEPDTIYSRLIFIQGVTGNICTTVVGDMECKTILDMPNAAKILRYILNLLPGYCVVDGVVDMSLNYQLDMMCKHVDLKKVCRKTPEYFCCTEYQSNVYAWHMRGIGKKLVGLAITSLFFIILLIAKETHLWYRIQLWFRKRNFRCMKNPNTALVDSCIPMKNVDADVAEENRRINESDITTLKKTDCLVLKNLCKVYKKRIHAVDHLNLGVKRGEIFGLLGINGAGKTTVFKILTGEIKISAGEAFIDAYSVKTDLKRAHSHIGYCPQFDACLNQLTGTETLRMFATLKGIKPHSIPRLIEHIGESLLFTEFLNNRVGSYSGGNKRKLSTALAMIGQPSVIFLDEPTAGMDPEARRHVWNAVSLVRDSGTSVLLTSHLMEEAEALCSRLGVMVKGQFRCLGSPQHLKNKLGGGLTIVAQMSQSLGKLSPRFNNLSEGGMSENYDDSGGIQDASDLKNRGTQNVVEESLKFPSRRKADLSWFVVLKKFDAFITQILPGCKLQESHTGYVKYHLAEERTPWSQIFAGMEEAKQLFNLEAYSVGQVNMENVFFNCIQQE